MWKATLYDEYKAIQGNLAMAANVTRSGRKESNGPIISYALLGTGRR